MKVYIMSETVVLAHALTSWFHKAARTLPWRQEAILPDGVGRDPYKVWLSEIMLQQTRVSVVEGYYKKFIARFPTIQDLAAAPESEVLGMWSGLGYYARGRNLHKAAQYVVAERQGIFPKNYQELLTMPGVGTYTAAAVSSLAYGEKVAVVDGNVARILSRLYAYTDPVDNTAGKDWVQKEADRLMSTVDDVNQKYPEQKITAGSINEGMMELGALVCTPKSPMCLVCPWRDSCAARKEGVVDILPKKLPKKERKTLRVAVVVVYDDDHLWLEKRSSDGLFAGMHEPPSLEIADTASSDEIIAAWQQILRDRNLPIPQNFPESLVVERTLTHRDLRMEIFPCQIDRMGHLSEFWLSASQLGKVGLSSAVQGVLSTAWPFARISKG